MTKQVIFFTADKTATIDELANIAKLQAVTYPPYKLTVMNGVESPNYGYGKAETDYVSGTVPTSYSGVAVIDPDNIPTQGLAATQAVVSDQQVLTVDGGTVTLSVADGVVTATYKPTAT